MCTANIVDFDRDGNVAHHWGQPISNLLSAEPGTKWLPGTEWILRPESNLTHALRWIHIPVNNPTWIEILLIKWTMLIKKELPQRTQENYAI
ncbi:hypothetical protein BDW74DRAFT_53005 [Aspergillus multicolor]|uniref:uncharacterized protein n=1 Tax=Aspergillus multicolor TaxID=41759 RepID=UPI003CCE4280